MENFHKIKKMWDWLLYIQKKIIPNNCTLQFIIFAGSFSLQQIIDREPICSGKVHHFSKDIATALEYIHNLKIVHLDLKPSNILVTSYNVAKLGKAKLMRTSFTSCYRCHFIRQQTNHKN